METNTNSDLFDLQIDLQKVVAINATKGLTVDQALALIGAYVLQKTKFDIIEKSAFNSFIRLLNNHFKGNRKTELLNSSFCDAVLAVNEWLLQSASEKKKEWLLSFGLKVITGVDEGNYLSFNDKTFNYYSTKSEYINGRESPKLYEVGNLFERVDSEEDAAGAANADFSEKAIIEKIKGSEEFEDPNNLGPKQIRENVRPVEIDEKKGTRRIAKKAEEVNAPFVKLFNDLVKREDGSRSEDSFAWQWLLTLNEYNEIKSCVSNNEIPTPSAMFKSTASLLALYIGEFYKREYEGDINPFSAKSADFFKKLCISLDIKQYRKSNDAHLFSLYVRGGLPVHYISKKLDEDKSNALIDALADLLVDDVITQEEGAEKLANNVKNTAIRESYGQRHSIFEYIQALRNESLTWSTTDNESHDFNDFRNKITCAKNKARERGKFKFFFSLWTLYDKGTLREFVISPELRLNPEEDGGRHYALSPQTLRKWGFQTEQSPQFELKIDNENSLFFTWCCNGDYISNRLKDRVSLPKFHKDELSFEKLACSDISPRIICGKDEKEFPERAVVRPFRDHYLQFYTNDDPSMASWTSFKGGQSFLWSGIIYDKSKYALLSTFDALDLKEDFGWVYFKDSIVLEDLRKHKTITLYNSKGQIYARVNKASIHSILKNPLIIPESVIEGEMDCTIDNITVKSHLICASKIVFDLYRVATDEQINGTPVVSYKRTCDYNNLNIPWSIYDPKSKNLLPQGLYTFKLSYARYGTEINCFVLKDNATIEASAHPPFIRFVDFPETFGAVNLARTVYEGGVKFDISDSKSIYEFKIGSNDTGSFYVKTHHPRPQTYAYLHGKDITSEPIIIAYSDSIIINNISSNVNESFRLSEKENVYKLLFTILTSTVSGNNLSSISRIDFSKISTSIKENSLFLRAYTQEIRDNDDANKYLDFYFLNFENNDVFKVDNNAPITSAKTKSKELRHNGLLFQSLANTVYEKVYCAPKYISYSGGKLDFNNRQQERCNRLSEYARDKMFLDDYAFEQFQIACEHQLYFAVFDSLLSMCWNSRRRVFANNFSQNYKAFKSAYYEFCQKRNIAYNTLDLLRLEREFRIDNVNR